MILRKIQCIRDLVKKKTTLPKILDGHGPLDTRIVDTVVILFLERVNEPHFRKQN